MRYILKGQAWQNCTGFMYPLPCITRCAPHALSVPWTVLIWTYIVFISVLMFILSLSLSLKVRLWLEEILWDKKYNMDVYRCKGVLSVLNSDQLHTLQVMFDFKCH